MSGAARLADALPGAELFRLVPLHGGDLSEVLRAELKDGRQLVLKRGPLVAREARMLGALAAAGARVPAVLGVAGDLMALDWLPPSPASAAAWAECGQSLRRAHDARGPDYGWDEDYAFGPVAIPNAPLTDWPAFWAERRLLPFLPHLDPGLARRIEALAARLPELLPARPLAGLLHGDLWSGNVHFTARTAALIDPACYRGHGEVDLAMLDLFGAIPAAFLEGYGCMEPGETARRPVYQLWPALVHLRLFGGGYRAMVTGLLDRIGRL